MPPKSKTKETKRDDSLREDLFLRSINLCYDADVPERIEHFHPTSKSTTLINALLGNEKDRAFLVVAPYGSGKSLTATYQLHLIENRPESQEAITTIEKRLKQVSPELCKFSASRRRKKVQGLTIALHGHAGSLPEALKAGLLSSMKRLKLGRQAKGIQSLPANTIDEAIILLKTAQTKFAGNGIDRIVIMWDEFGRHLETLLAEGQASALGDIQSLAEFASRSKKIPITLAMFLHQGLLHYAGNAPQNVRSEWTKIEGRFQTIQYVDDSKEILRLLGAVVSSRGPSCKVPKKTFTGSAREAKKLGLFKDLTQTELADLFMRIYPLSPITLFLLPRVSARVAQNERTLFSFVYSMALDRTIDAEDLYDYFSPVLRADTALGGTHRQWLETQSAISKVQDDPNAMKCLKSACLLGLGTGGERSRSGKQMLRFALTNYTRGIDADKAIDALIDRKLLLHRKHNDEVSVWHGTDADLRGRLEDEKRRLASGFDAIKYLTDESPSPIWKSVQYNDDAGVCRYFTGSYQTPGGPDALSGLFSIPEFMPHDGDGTIFHLVAETADELKSAETKARELKGTEFEQLVVVIPRHTMDITDAALEVASLERMQRDPDLVAVDPLVLPELQQMTDDARAHLQRSLDRLIWPSIEGPRWFYLGEEFDASSPRALRHKLSEIMRNVFPQCPRIFNEMIVRKKASATVVNARKKLLMGILERTGRENLGITGNFPDASMFRTVLLHTGLYRQDGHGKWGFAQPEDLEDKQLGIVWKIVKEFFTKPSSTPKNPRTELFEKLIVPPIGLRQGLLPIFLAAGMKAFPSPISLSRNNEYVVDVLPSVIEDLCKQPDSYRLTVLDLDKRRLGYLKEISRMFSPIDGYTPPDADLVRICFDLIENWKAAIPPAALTTRKISSKTMEFRRALTRSADITEILFNRIPKACAIDLCKTKTLLKAIDSCKIELESVAATYHDSAAQSLRQSLAFGRINQDQGLRQLAQQWAKCFPTTAVNQLKDQAAKGLITRMLFLYESDEQLSDSISSLILGKPVAKWDDSTTSVFDRTVHETVHRIEDHMLSSCGKDSDTMETRVGLSELAAVRISELVQHLVELVGEEDAAKPVEEILSTLKQGAKHGNDE